MSEACVSFRITDSAAESLHLRGTYITCTVPDCELENVPYFYSALAYKKGGKWHRCQMYRGIPMETIHELAKRPVGESGGIYTTEKWLYALMWNEHSSAFLSTVKNEDVFVDEDDYVEVEFCSSKDHAAHNEFSFVAGFHSQHRSAEELLAYLRSDFWHDEDAVASFLEHATLKGAFLLRKVDDDGKLSVIRGLQMNTIHNSWYKYNPYKDKRNGMYRIDNPHMASFYLKGDSLFPSVSNLSDFIKSVRIVGTGIDARAGLW